MNQLRIVVGDDQALMRETIRFVFDEDAGTTVVGEAESGAALLELMKRIEADVVLLDLTMPPLDGLECLERLREEHPDVTVVVLSGCEDPRQIEAAFSGSEGLATTPIGECRHCPVPFLGQGHGHRWELRPCPCC